MSEARSRNQWLHTSWILAQIHNQWADKDSLKTPEDFNPWLRELAAKREQESRLMVPITALKVLVAPEAMR